MRLTILLLFISSLYSCHKNVQSIALAPSSEEIALKKSKTFPQDWLGYWEGELNIYNHTGKTMTIPMALDNAATDNDSIWTWAIIYGEDTIAGRRDYELNVVDASKGHYVVDEKNSILIDAYLLDNNLMSTFNVAGSIIRSSYELDGEEMLFSIQMYNDKVIRTTGDTIYNGEEIPIVKSYQNAVLQKARLKKIR